MQNTFKRQIRLHKSGAALVIVLAFLILLTVLVVAFFSRAATEREVSNNSASQTKAELLSRSAGEIIIGDLKQELAAGSTAYISNGTTIYTPAADPAAVAPLITPSVVPWVSGAPAPASGTLPIPNLIRRSARASDATVIPYPSYYTNPPPNRASAVNSTADVSANGRSVNLTKWNEHYLIPTSGTTSSTPVSNFTAPDWVMVTSRSGPTVLTKPDPSTIGRFAYAIYDEGGLLDANVAGCPSNVITTGTQYGPKGFAAFSDLTALGLSQQQVDNLVGWRNYATAQPGGSLAGNYNFNANSATSYFNFILGGTNGFLTINTNNYAPSGTAGLFTSSPMTFGSPAKTDQVFPNRQALIKFWTANGFSTSSLQFFGTFTRDLNRPNFVPLTNPPVTRTLSPPQLTYSGTTTDINPIVQNVLYSGTSSGQPVASQRFPLSQLALFSNPAANAAAIQKYFGLSLTRGTVNDNYTWNYNPTLAAASATTINTLAQVALLSPARAPNFFEMLQAAVLQGSIGCYTSNNVAAPAPSITPDIIIQMGVNLIDQYSANAYPTIISFNGQTFAGIKNLPYVSELLFWPYRPTSDPTRYTLNGYALLEVWNPHQNATDVSAAPQSLMATLGLNGGTYVIFSGTYVANGSTFPQMNMFSLLTGSDSITFSNSNAFQEPTVLGTPGDNDNVAGPQLVTVTSGSESRSGFLVGTANLPDHNLAKSMGDPLYASFPVEYNSCGWYGATNGCLILSFKDALGNWHPYQGNNSTTAKTNRLSPIVSQGQETATVNVNSPFPPNNTPVTADISFSTFDFISPKSFQLSDPRTQNGSGFFSGQSTYGQSVRPFTTGTLADGTYSGRYVTGDAFSDYALPYSPSTDTRLPYGARMGMLNENGTNSIYPVTTFNTWTADEDGVIRPGDGSYGANPFISGSSMAVRPALLGRPFRSVGEMGYADRGYGAWKSINFFSQESGDAGLLDFFSIDQAPVSAGKINLNTRQSPVLQAMLRGAYRTQPLLSGTGDTLIATDATAIANAIVAHTTATSPLPSPATYISGPLVTRADLVRSLLGDPAILSALANIQASSNDTSNITKPRREAFVRALADVGTTRTWNLLIDVVAQTGLYPPGAVNLKDFVVQGEKHYWLHVALDRYTGQIVDEQWELVNE